MTKAIKYSMKGYPAEGPEKDLIEDPKIARRNTTFYAQIEGDDKVPAPALGVNQTMTKAIKYSTAGYGGGPEKDLIEDPKIARRSTTFYAQLEGDDAKAPAEPMGINQQMTAAVRKGYTTAGYGEGPEKDLIEDPKIARRSTTFYAQEEPAVAGYPAPEKVNVIDPKIARTHTSFYN